MSELIPITAISIVLAFLSHYSSEYDPVHNRYGRKDRLWFGIMAVLMVLFCGLRTQYNDTDNYEYIYEVIIPSLSNISWKWGDNPAFWATNHILKKLGFSTQSFLLFYIIHYIIVLEFSLEKDGLSFA